MLRILKNSLYIPTIKLDLIKNEKWLFNLKICKDFQIIS